MEENRFDAKLVSNPSLSIVSSSIANTGGLRCCRQISQYFPCQNIALSPTGSEAPYIEV